jgi:hypothetical protein
MTSRLPTVSFRALCFAVVVASVPLATPAARSVPEALEKLRSAQSATSHAMHTLSVLADVHGPRLMGTPAYWRAASWSAERLRDWGADSVELQSFDEGQRGWATRGHSLEMMAPTYARLAAHPVAYTAATPGEVTGRAVLVQSPDTLGQHRGALKGAVVLLSSTFEPGHMPAASMWRRYTDDELRAAEANPDPNDRRLGHHARRPVQQVLRSYTATKAVAQAFLERCREEGVLALLIASGRAPGVLRVDGTGFVPSYSRVGDFTPLPVFAVTNEAFGRLVRLMQLGETPELRLRADSQIFEEAAYNVNVLADVRGTDLREQMVVVGAHLDGHPAGTAASDNAAGAAAVMEAMRLVRAAGLRPRRTIRFALWGGEEQAGFHGSGAYVRTRVGDLVTGARGPDHGLISAVLNLDNGAGRIRGVYAMGNRGAATLFGRLLAPFRAPEGPGDGAVTIQNANQSDHDLFDALGIPAFQLIQDPLGYDTFVHHTALDTVDYVPAADLQHNAVALAYLAYALANLDQPVPRRPFHSIAPQLAGRHEFAVTGFERAERVWIVGDFNNWSMFDTPLAKVDGRWIVRLDLPPGRYLYKYIVDGVWTPDPSTPPNALTTDGQGHGGLTVREVS